MPEWRGEPNVGALVRLVLVVASLVREDVLREAAHRLREQERDELLRKLFTDPADAEALAGAAKALRVDASRVGEVIRRALLAATG